MAMEEPDVQAQTSKASHPREVVRVRDQEHTILAKIFVMKLKEAHLQIKSNPLESAAP